MSEHPTKEQYLKKIQEIQENELKSERFTFIKTFIEQYKKRGALNKEKKLLTLIGNYNDDHIDEMNNGYLYTKEKKLNQYKKLSIFLDSLTKEEINSNLYLKISKYLFDICNYDC